MTFFRSRVVSKFDYYLNGETLYHSMGSIKDLGILFDLKLKFYCHIINIVNRSNKILGFTSFVLHSTFNVPIPIGAIWGGA